MDCGLPSSAKRRRRTSSASPSDGKLLCVPCYRRRASSSKGFDIYLVDLNSTENPVGDSISPTLFVDYFDVCTACVLGSTLYLFRSSDDLDGDPDCAGRSTPVATVDLFKYRNMKNVELDDSMVKYIKPMRHPKRFPSASATPGGKILVLSSHILFHPDAGVDRPNDFELYDPATDEWKQLPQLYERWDKGRKSSCLYSVTIKSFIFRWESVLVVTTENGMFELDLELCGGGWQDCLAPACKIPRYFGYPCLSAIEGELSFSHDYVFDVDIPISVPIVPICCQFPPMPLYSHDDYELQMALATVQPSGCGREVVFCRVQTALNKRSKRPPRMDIQVFKCDIARYREDKQDMLKKAQKELKKKQHVQDKVGPFLQIPAPQVQLSGRLEKSLEFVLETRRCSVFIPRELSFLSFGTDMT
ncbi:galactose oxidase/kelch repeat superfamily protein [Striga asiatica]|uniref:Galactose oxidase/kelch repeat superfamily protein n=1 Tax=Striga asiatica TaxID=4170 RepID=A0A5A7PZQ3_STRAF|nr:galactose oxidase/kelch repeat superfamily protein [Striga asiatica]